MRGLEHRFARAAAAVQQRVGPILEQEREEAQCRVALRCEVALANFVRPYRPPGYTSRAFEAVLRDGEWAAADLAEIPDTPELHRADEALLADDDLSDDLNRLREEFAQLVERFLGGDEPDPLDASTTEIMAFCIARAEAAGKPVTGICPQRLDPGASGRRKSA